MDSHRGQGFFKGSYCRKVTTLPVGRRGLQKGSGLVMPSRRGSEGDIRRPFGVSDDRFESLLWRSNDALPIIRRTPVEGAEGSVVSENKGPSTAYQSPSLARHLASHPSLTPLAAPASPRPINRRSFNTFPRPWKPRPVSPPSGDSPDNDLKDQKLPYVWQPKLPFLKYALSQEDQSNVETNVQFLFTNSGSLSRSSNPPQRQEAAAEALPFFRSETHLVLLGSASKAGPGVELPLAPMRERRSAEANERHQREGETPCTRNGDAPLSESPPGPKFSSSAEQICCTASEALCPSGANGRPSARVVWPCEARIGSLSSDYQQLPQRVSHVRDQCAFSRVPYNGFEEAEKTFAVGLVSAGGSGPLDRQAPLSVCPQSPPSSQARRFVRKRPEIPNNLFRRKSEENHSDSSSEEGKYLSSPHKGTESVIKSPVVRGTVPGLTLTPPTPVNKQGTYPIPPTPGNPTAPSRISVNTILASLNFARFRLGELTGGLGGNKKEVGKCAPLPGGNMASKPKNPASRPPRSRLDLEKLRKNTERLKSSSVDRTCTEDTPMVCISGGQRGSTADEFVQSGQSVKHITVSRNNSAPPPFGRGRNAPSPTAVPALGTGAPQSNAHAAAKQRVLPTRDIPFRTASVSHVDLSNRTRYGPCSAGLRVYPACKDSWKHHTLPRAKMGLADAGETENRDSNPEAARSDVRNDHLTPDRLETKSKSESELSAGFNPYQDVKMSSDGDLSCVGEKPFDRSDTKYVADETNVDSDTSESRNASPTGILTPSSCAFASCSVNSVVDVCAEAENDSQASCSEVVNQNYAHSSVIHDLFIPNSSEVRVTSDIDSPREPVTKDSVDSAQAVCKSPVYRRGNVERTDASECTEYFSENENYEMATESQVGPEDSSNSSVEKWSSESPVCLEDSSTSPVGKGPSECPVCPEDSSTSPVGKGPSESPLGPKESSASPVGKAHCEVVQTEPRTSQCLVIRSGSFREDSDDGDPSTVTSECRVLPSRFCLPREDSDDKDGQPSVEDVDSRTEDGKDIDVPPREPLSPTESKESSAVPGFSKSERNSSRRRRRGGNKAKEQAANRQHSSLHCEGPAKMAAALPVNVAQENVQDQGEANTDPQSTPLSPNSPSQLRAVGLDSAPPALPNIPVILAPRVSDRQEKKKKHRSDPIGDRRLVAEDGSLQFSDSGIDFSQTSLQADEKEVLDGRMSKGIVSQTSTDSEGKEDSGFFQFHQGSDSHVVHSLSPPFFYEHEGDAAAADASVSHGDIVLGRSFTPRNVSPAPYCGDSDSGDRSAPRSPHIPRRYSKRPLRGPYGKMLEEEMSKSKWSSQFLTDDLFFLTRETKGASLRPPSPLCQSVDDSDMSSKHQGVESSPNTPAVSYTGSKSLDDSALRLYYFNSVASEGSPPPKSSPSAPHYPYESDSEGNCVPVELPSGPLHQRTASSPSNLLSVILQPPEEYLGPQQEELGGVAEQETSVPKANEVDYYEAATKLLLSTQRQHRHHKKSMEQHHLKLPKGQKHQDSHRRTLAEGDGRSTSEHRHGHRRHRDTRPHIVQELYETEKNYVENLQFLITRYQASLKGPEFNTVADPSLVDDLFYQVPEILQQHEKLLCEMRNCLNQKDSTIGNIITDMVREPQTIESYTSFVSNWKTAREAADSLSQSKTVVQFFANMAREHPGKLDLKTLLISVVQRFPHYELLLKRLVEHTSKDHPDLVLLQEALCEVQRVSEAINDVKQEALRLEQHQFKLRDIENIIEGLEGLVQPDRTFLQVDHVTQQLGHGLKEDRCLFLFSDLLIIASIKRRSATIRKSSSVSLSLPSSLESCKLKLFKFVPLDEVEITRTRDERIKKIAKELEEMAVDLRTLQQISRLTSTLHCTKVTLEEVIHEIDASIRKQVMERQCADANLNELELNITSQQVVRTLSLSFQSAEDRTAWEDGFNSAKQKLANSANKRPPPEFHSSMPIRKTRAGLQFTCAAPTLGLNAHNLRDVWVCNSDGYVGQICVLSFQPQPTVTCCNGVCNARILSIASIPPAPQQDSSEDDDDDEIPVDDERMRRSESLPPEMGSEEYDAQSATMWLGTEDGSVHVYNSSDTIRTKNKFKFQPGSPVHSIIYHESKVFASLANGDIVTYERDVQGSWSCAEKCTITVSSAAAPVTRMVVVLATGKIWCSTLKTIKVLNTSSLTVETSFHVGGENSKGVSYMVSAGHGVWIAMQNSATVRLFHAATHDCVCEVTVTPLVTRMLAGCDDIIRQHKAACLRVTSLLACKDLLWIGTSAGVILTLPLPHLASNTRRIQPPPSMEALPHGHTGHVRFLTCVEMSPEKRPSRCKSHARSSLKEHQGGGAAPSKLWVISGGDGYEDFRSTGISEVAGRDDSTNHLLLWIV